MEILKNFLKKGIKTILVLNKTIAYKINNQNPYARNSFQFEKTT